MLRSNSLSIHSVIVKERANLGQFCRKEGKVIFILFELKLEQTSFISYFQHKLSDINVTVTGVVSIVFMPLYMLVCVYMYNNSVVSWITDYPQISVSTLSS